MVKPESIQSLKNPLLKDVRRALLKGTLTPDGLCVAETFHLLEEALSSQLDVPIVIAAESVREAVSRHIKGLRSVRLAVTPDSVFSELSSTETAQGVMALVRPPVWGLDQVMRGSAALLMVLDGLQDPGNAGAIVRAAEAFRGTGVVFLKGTVSPWNSKTVRASAGSLFRLPMVHGVENALLRSSLQQRRIDLYATVPRGGKSLREVDLTRPCAFMIGSEGRGVSTELRNAAFDLHIPTSGVESLNAAVAAGVLLYEASRQRLAVS